VTEVKKFFLTWHNGADNSLRNITKEFSRFHRNDVNVDVDNAFGGNSCSTYERQRLKTSKTEWVFADHATSDKKTEFTESQL